MPHAASSNSSPPTSATRTRAALTLGHASGFFGWCEDRGLTLTAIRPHDVATYIETLQQTHSAPSVKQQLAAVRMLFDWLITGQIMPANPASAVRGPKHVVKTGKTPVLEGVEWRKLLASIPTETVRDLRDRALIATPYSFARIGAALKMKVEDLRPHGSAWTIRLHEKGESSTPCRVITRSLRCCMPTSRLPASQRIARVFCSARHADIRPRVYPMGPWSSPMPGA
jgi:site-specific recombinase XerD